MSRILGECSLPLAQAYDTALFDLDGVVYIGAEPVPHAVESVTAAIGLGQRTVYVTNNASRPPDAVAEHLSAFGLAVCSDDVMTSAMATAQRLSEWVTPGASVMAVGGEGLRIALRGNGFGVLDPLDDGAVLAADAVVMGFGPDLAWRDLAAAAAAVRRGIPFIATNGDRTVPTSFGTAPGNGALVDAVAAASRPPDAIVGKPQPTMFTTAAAWADAGRPLVVGDRLDTDIEGATASGFDSLLVFTGVTDVRELLSAPPPHRPTYIAADLRGLLVPHGAPRHTDGGWELGGWRAELRDARVAVTAALADGGDPIDAVRVACVAAWAQADARPWTPPTDVVGLPSLAAIASAGVAE